MNCVVIWCCMQCLLSPNGHATPQKRFQNVKTRAFTYFHVLETPSKRCVRIGLEAAL